jgi:hypothetical protein
MKPQTLFLLVLAAATGVFSAGPAYAQTTTHVAGTVVVGSGDRISGSGHVIEVSRTPGSFSALRINGPIDVQLKASDRELVTVSFDDNLINLVETQIIPGSPAVLDIGIAKGAAFRSSAGPKVVIEFKNLSELSLRGSGDLRADRVRGPMLAVSISGSSDIRINELDVDVLGVAIAGSGDFRAAGRAAEQGYSIAGSGDILVPEVAGKVVKVRIAGSGDARVNAEESLEVTIAGSGDVFYRGKPAIIKKIAGSGNLKHIP